MAKRDKKQEIVDELTAKWEGQNDFPKWSANMNIMHELSDEYVAIANKYAEFCKDYERCYMPVNLRQTDDAYLDAISYTNPSAFLHGMKYALELMEKRRVLFNIAYCLNFYKIKDVVDKAIKNPRYNGSTGFAADFDYIFEPNNFLRIYEGT